MKLAIMQPYFFPYIGYFQLIMAADKFIFYDDVNFIKQGWINRNRILLQGKPQFFSVPLSGAGSYTKICDVEIDKTRYKHWKDKFYKTIIQNYKNAEHFKKTSSLIEDICDAEPDTINSAAKMSVETVCQYLEIKTEIIESSSKYGNEELKGQERIIDICKKESAKGYINAEGGTTLYSREIFSKNNIELKFLKSKPIQYTQFSDSFIPHLSIIDLLMHNSINDLFTHLNSFELI